MKLIAILLLAALFQASPVQAPAAEIAGFPVVVEENQAAALASYQWEVLPCTTDESWTVDSFATDGSSRCAIGIRDHVLIYEKTTCIAKYRFATPGAYELAFEDGNLVIYAVREEQFIVVDCKTETPTVYRQTGNDTGSRIRAQLETDPGDIHVQTGYYLTNHLGNRQVKLGYDMLVYVEDGVPVTVYETNTKLILEGVWVVAVLSVGGFFLSRLYRKRKQRSGKAAAS